MHHHHLDSRWCTAKADGVERLRYSHMTIICLHAWPHHYMLSSYDIHFVSYWHCYVFRTTLWSVLHFAWCTMHVMEHGFTYLVNSTEVWLARVLLFCGRPCLYKK
jgi:hypothetical protein